MKIKMFALNDLFSIFKGKRLTKADMISGNTNYLGAISDNNGIREKIGQEPIFEGNCITINYNGSVGETFYQIKPFWASDDVNVLFLKNRKLTKNIALYLVTIIKANKYRFSYGRKWTLEKMLETEIPLPINDNNHIDWEYMEDFIKKLHHKKITTKNIKKSKTIDFSQWKEFRVGDIFITEKIRGECPPFNSLERGSVDVVSTTELNNGVIGKYDVEKAYNHKITVSFNGACGYFSFHENFFNANGDIGILKEKFKLNKFNAMFLCTILNKLSYKYQYGRKLNGNRLKDEIILLPTKDNKPDWAYMENYIKSLPYGDRI